ncbi:hypothetical protein CR970_02185, partial [Candidatus Saccharibacteria bacterium]
MSASSSHKRPKTRATANTDDGPLLTVNAKRAHYHSLFRQRSRGMFLPDTAFYNKLHTDSGLRACAHELFRWIGAKPRKLRIAYGQQTADGAQSNDSIILPEQLRSHPFQAGAALAVAVLQNAIAARAQGAIEDDFVEFASVESGLGVLVINGLYAPYPGWQQVVHNVFKDWEPPMPHTLAHYQPTHYCEEVVHFAEANHVSTRRWTHYVHTPALRHLPIDSLPPRHSQPLPKAEALRRSITLRHIAAIVLIALAAAGIVIIGLYVYGQRPRSVTDPKAL